MGDCQGREGAHLCPLAESAGLYRPTGEEATHLRPPSGPSGRLGDIPMFPNTTADFPNFDDVRRALPLESLAPDVAREEAEADPSLHVEVEEE